jgi:hypothetical protein
MANYNKRHWQHTKEFERELNTPTNKVFQPFRMSDCIMMIGKYKGQHLSIVPKHYLNWLLKNYRGLSIGAKQQIKKFI